MSRFIETQITLRHLTLWDDSPPRIVNHGGPPGESRLARYWRRLTTRRALYGLSDELLKDIGLTRAQAQAEAKRWFWAP